MSADAGNETTDVLHRAAEKWDTVAAAESEQPRRGGMWQQVPVFRQHINQKICGKPLDGFNVGLNHQLAVTLDGRTAARAISVGCGLGIKEYAILHHGFVEHFDLFDISAEMREGAQQRAEKRGFADRVTISGEDAFEVATGPYDLVHWNSSLHHMLDTRAALEWSRSVLAPGGVLYVREFAGPNRFEWTERQLELANRFRRALPERFRRIPDEPDRLRGARVKAIDPSVTEASDPTEAVDSANIAPALAELFPDARVWHLGGVIYRIALTNILDNFDHERDEDWLRMALAADDYCIDLGESVQLAALAVKPA